MSIAGAAASGDLRKICPLVSRRTHAQEYGEDRYAYGPGETRIVWRRASRTHCRAVLGGGYEQTLELAHAVKACGGDMLRGGAFKPRTSPHDFQGLGLAGLQILHEVGQANGLADRYRSDGSAPGGTGRRICGHAADRLPQYAELSASGGSWALWKAGAVETRYGRKSLRMAGSCGIHRQGRQLQYCFVRARNQGLPLGRIFAIHSGLECLVGAAARNLSPGHRRSQSRHRSRQHGGVGQPFGN